MRLWSVHPGYLDQKGLVAVWREGLLAQAVLSGRTRGYRNHPQLARFRTTASPPAAIAAYLRPVCAEARRRGYRFDETKVESGAPAAMIPVPVGQIAYEWARLAEKLARRAPQWWAPFAEVEHPRAHPMFVIVSGTVADWEMTTGDAQRSR